MIRIFSKNSKEEKIKELKSFKPGTWVYVERPTKEELERLENELHLEAGLLHDALDFGEVPRLEIEKGGMYVFTRFVYNNEDDILTAPMLIVVKKDYVITITPHTFPRLESFLRGKIKFGTIEQIKFFLILSAQIQSTYTQYLNVVTKRLYKLSSRVVKIQNKDIILFVRYESVLNNFSSSLVRINGIFSSLLSGKIVELTEHEMDNVEDLSLESMQLIEITKDSLRNIANIREAYSTIMTNNLNRVIKLFTSLTVILTIPTIIASLYGMNVHLPLDNIPYAFEWIVLVILVLIITSIAIFVYKDWL